MAGVELGSAFISVGLGTNKLGPEIKKAFADVDGVAASSGSSAGKTFSGKFSGFMKSAAVPALGAVAGIGLMAKSMGDVAANAEQNLGAVETVFGSAADGVKRFSENSANSVGLSASSYNELSAVTGTALKGAGVSVDELAAKNDALITRGADLASVFGGDTATAVSAMGSAFRGEFDPLEQYGITLTAAQVSAELAARGQDKLGGAALDAAKKQATMDLIMQQSAGSAGNFAKEADTASGAQQRSNAAWEDASAKLGEVLLPIMTTVATKVSEMSKWVSENSGLVTGLAIGIGILAGVIGVWSVVQSVLNLVMLASPITWVILGIFALIATVVALVMNWQAVVDFLTVVWGGFMNWCKEIIDGFVVWWNQVWASVGQFISDTWNNIVSWVTGAINNVSNTISDGFNAVWNFIQDVLGNIGNFFSDTWNNITRGISDFVGGIGKFFESIPGTIQGALSGAATWLYNSGRDIVNGLFDGIKSLAGTIGNFFLGLLPGWIVEPFKIALGIHSPSRVFAGFGVNIGQGLINGIDGMSGKIESSVTGMVSVPPVPAFGSGSYTATMSPAGRSPIYVQNPFTGDYLLAQVGSVASGVVQSTDANSQYMRRGR